MLQINSIKSKWLFALSLGVVANLLNWFFLVLFHSQNIIPPPSDIIPLLVGLTLGFPYALTVLLAAYIPFLLSRAELFHFCELILMLGGLSLTRRYFSSLPAYILVALVEFILVIPIASLVMPFAGLASALPQEFLVVSAVLMITYALIASSVTYIASVQVALMGKLYRLRPNLILLESLTLLGFLFLSCSLILIPAAFNLEDLVKGYHESSSVILTLAAVALFLPVVISPVLSRSLQNFFKTDQIMPTHGNASFASPGWKFDKPYALFQRDEWNAPEELSQLFSGTILEGKELLGLDPYTGVCVVTEEGKVLLMNNRFREISCTSMLRL